jgi:hypothetical protein
MEVLFSRALAGDRWHSWGCLLRVSGLVPRAGPRRRRRCWGRRAGVRGGKEIAKNLREGCLLQVSRQIGVRHNGLRLANCGGGIHLVSLVPFPVTQSAHRAGRRTEPLCAFQQERTSWVSSGQWFAIPGPLSSRRRALLPEQPAIRVAGRAGGRQADRVMQSAVTVSPPHLTGATPASVSENVRRWLRDPRCGTAARRSQSRSAASGRGPGRTVTKWVTSPGRTRRGRWYLRCPSRLDLRGSWVSVIGGADRSDAAFGALARMADHCHLLCALPDHCS